MKGSFETSCLYMALHRIEIWGNARRCVRFHLPRVSGVSRLLLMCSQPYLCSRTRCFPIACWLRGWERWTTWESSLGRTDGRHCDYCDKKLCSQNPCFENVRFPYCWVLCPDFRCP